MLHMPSNRKVDYHLVTAAHLASTCGFPTSEISTIENVEAGCELRGQVTVVTHYLPHQHELIHAYMDLLAPGAAPLPMVTEGTADAIGCNDGGWFMFPETASWQQTVLGTPQTDSAQHNVYEGGGKLIRYLIRTQGIDAVVRYYRQAPQRRDPALFAANFLSFWGMTIDDVWAAMQVRIPGADRFEQKICPCSLPALPLGGAPISDDVTTAPYWTLSGAPAGSLALSAAAGQGLMDLKDCLGLTPDLQPHDAGVASIYRLPQDDRLRYLPAAVAAASAGDYVSDTCEGAAPYPLPAALLADGGASLNVSLIQQTMASQTFYLQVQLPAPSGVPVSLAVQACPTCDFTQRWCNSVPDPDAGITEVQHFPAGPVYLKVTVPALLVGESPPLETSAQIFFQ
jgi:hypothetical protein